MINSHSPSKYFQSTDISLCACLLVFDFKVIDMDKSNPRRIVFFFKKTKEIENFSKKYYQHELQVEPMRFFQCLKELKARIYN